MRREDRSVFFRRAKRYYRMYRTAEDKVRKLFQVFCDAHPEVLSGEKYGLSKEWSSEEEVYFGDLINVGVQLERKQQKVVDAFIVSMREFRKRALREGARACCRDIIADLVAKAKGGLGRSSAESNGLRGAQVQSASVSTASCQVSRTTSVLGSSVPSMSVTKSAASASASGDVSAVSNILGASARVSEAHCGTFSSVALSAKLRRFCDRHPYVLKLLESEHFTWRVQCKLRRILDGFPEDDRCLLRAECERYYARFRDSDFEVFKRLIHFCAQHHEVLKAPGYTAHHGWSSDMRDELRNYIHAITDELYRKKRQFQLASKFILSIPKDLPDAPSRKHSGS